MRLQLYAPWASRAREVLRRRTRPAAPAITTAPFPVSKDWDEAHTRVESYLRAHGIDSRILIAEFTREIVKAARDLAKRHPAEKPVALAMQLTHARLGEWLVSAMGKGDWADQRFRARGRLALLMSELPQRQPEALTAVEELSAELRTKLATLELQPSPELRRVSMPPSTLEFTLGQAIEDKWTTFHRSVFVKASASWLIIAGAAGLTWFATH